MWCLLCGSKPVFEWDTKLLYTLSPYVGIFKGGTSIRVINYLEPSHDPAVWAFFWRVVSPPKQRTNDKKVPGFFGGPLEPARFGALEKSFHFMIEQ